MRRFVGIIVIIVVALFYCFSGESGLVCFAKSNVDNVIVLCNDDNEKLISISEEDLECFLDKLNLQNYNKFLIEDRVIIEGYSNKIRDYIIINNNKINIQISVFGGECLVGSPIIKNSF